MAGFVKRSVSIDQDSIGSYIKKIRERKGLDIYNISDKIGVNAKYLIAIENGNYKDLPKGIYSKIFFKKYIDFLGVRYKNIVNDFVKEQNRSQNFESNIFFNRVVDWKNLLSFPKFLRNVLVFFIVIVCFFYLLFYFRNIFSPPSLNVDHPLENQIVKEYYIKVEGETEPESEVKINGQLILIDRDGSFSEGVHLKSGVNVITTTSKKKYSKENEVVRRVLVEEAGE